MALPAQLKTARLTEATIGKDVDNLVGDIEKAIADILGVPIDTNISNQLFGVIASGLTKIIFQNLGGDPAVTGELARNGARLKFHDGTAVQSLAQLSDIGPQTNAYGRRTISAEAPSGTPADGDIWDQY